MELLIVLAVVWILVLPIGAVMLLFSAPLLYRRRARRFSGDLAPVVPLRPTAGPARRRVA
jgi:hypothetical protein